MGLRQRGAVAPMKGKRQRVLRKQCESLQVKKKIVFVIRDVTMVVCAIWIDNNHLEMLIF